MDTPELLSDSFSKKCFPATGDPLSPASLKGRPPEQYPGGEEVRSAGTASNSAAGVLPDQRADPECQRGGNCSLMNGLMLVDGSLWERGRWLQMALLL